MFERMNRKAAILVKYIFSGFFECESNFVLQKNDLKASDINTGMITLGGKKELVLYSMGEQLKSCI